MAKKYLIVNADDYNTDIERNRGILQAAREGIVTRVSIIANQMLEEKDVTELKKVFDTKIGIHLNLTLGSPIIPHTKTLVNNNGQYLEKQKAWRRAMLHGYDLNEVKMEFSAQIKRLKEAGITPNHIDGNNHIHVFPGIAKVVAQIAKDYKIFKVRIPFESFKGFKSYFRYGAAKKYFIGKLSKSARLIFKESGMYFPDRFSGIQFPRIANIDSLRAFIRNLPEGTNELMCHPGYHSISKNPFSTIEREQELFALTHPSVINDIMDFNINLVSYKDL